jgi:hypothetical protein
VQHAILRVLVRATSGKGARVLDALEVPRPGAAKPVLPVVSPLALAALAGGERKGVNDGR